MTGTKKLGSKFRENCYGSWLDKIVGESPFTYSEEDCQPRISRLQGICFRARRTLDGQNGDRRLGVRGSGRRCWSMCSCAFWPSSTGGRTASPVSSPSCGPRSGDDGTCRTCCDAMGQPIAHFVSSPLRSSPVSQDSEHSCGTATFTAPKEVLRKSLNPAFPISPLPAP